MLRKLERLDKDEFTEDERADAEEVCTSRFICTGPRIYTIIITCTAPTTAIARGKFWGELTDW